MKEYEEEWLARDILQEWRWPDGVICPHCENSDMERMGYRKSNAKASIREGLWYCYKCDNQFTITVGTAFEGTHLSMITILKAFDLMAASRCQISARKIQMSLHIGSYRSAWSLKKRIMADRVFWPKYEPPNLLSRKTQP